MKRLALIIPFLLTGCMESLPVRPVLTCVQCHGLEYYGPQAPDPRVEMARALTGGLSTVVGAAIHGDVLKSLHQSAGAASTIERTSSSVTDRSVSSSETSRESSISETSNTLIDSGVTE